MDFVGNFSNPDDVYEMYASCRNDGWLPMDDKDILETAGIVVKKPILPWYIGVGLLVLALCWSVKIIL